MGVLQSFERRLEGIVTGTFARIFRSAVQPVEIASALQRELDNSAQVLSREASLVPNDFVIELSPSDHDRLAPYSGKLGDELSEVVNRYARAESYAFTGPVAVSLERTGNLTTGRFRVRSSAVAAVTPHGRQHPGGRPAAQPPAPQPLAPPPASSQQVSPPAEESPSEEAQAPPAPARAAAASPVPFLEVNGARHELNPPGLVLGRGVEADLRITDPGVSRRHVEVRVERRPDGTTAVTVHDLGSTNGTVVNGKRIDQVRVGDGAQILLGNTVLVVHQPDPEG